VSKNLLINVRVYGLKNVDIKKKNPQKTSSKKLKYNPSLVKLKIVCPWMTFCFHEDGGLTSQVELGWPSVLGLFISNPEVSLVPEVLFKKKIRPLQRV
jgi:hypothetical protein